MPMLYNRIHAYIHGEIWNSINKIVKNRSLTLLYRGEFNDNEYNDAKEKLEKSWSRVNFEIIDGNDEKAILINLIQ